jgi:phosphatidylserine/phosphatidylglycerophosphate/cardiolipin synthase-like enzyme
MPAPARLVAALVSALLLGGVAQASADETSAPPASPGIARFNDPTGSEAAQYALVRRVDRAVDRTPGGATIRLAAYSFAMPSTSRALLRAHRRGVRVQVVVDDRSARWGSVRRLRSVLGTSTRRHSFVRVCHRSCRGTTGNQHAKFVTISRTGRAEGLVMLGSMNFTAYAAARQWQDLYVVRDRPGLFRELRAVFRSMLRDRAQGDLPLGSAGDGLLLDVAPVHRTDLNLRRLDLVRCRGAADGTGWKGRTVVRVSMHAWNGDRGVALARRLVALRARGCNVRVLAGVGFGRQVRSVLERGEVPMRRTRAGSGYTHEKLLLVSGRYAGRRDAGFVWTGSHNWTDRSLHNDEVTLRVAGQRLVAAYQRNFKRIWDLTGSPSGG